MIVIPVYNMTILPHANIPFPADRYREVAHSNANIGDEVVFLFARNNENLKKLSQNDFYPCAVKGTVSLVNDSYLIIKTEERMHIESVSMRSDFTLTIAMKVNEESDDRDVDEIAKIQKLKDELINYVAQFRYAPLVKPYLNNLESLADIICALSPWMNLNNEERYNLLALNSLKERDAKIEEYVYEFLSMAAIHDEAKSAEEEDYRKVYREQALRKQISYLQNELDEMHPESSSDVKTLEEKVHNSGMNALALKEAEKVLNRLKQENQNSAEYGLLTDYLSFMTSLNWHKEEFKHIDLADAKAILERDHYGLNKVKKRVIEQIAVMNRKESLTGSILCFVGAPGTGKTSIGKSIAEALDRPFVRISLGGVHDESDIRGHRRTYIGAMPGRILDAIAKCGSSAPVVLLDEIDKLGASYNGDPSSALLEVLDPEQNNSFTDHYLNVPYDLSDVFFICTANTLDSIAEPLLNRMEVINFSGYTRSEKFMIAKKHLINKAEEKNGIKKNELKISDGAYYALIDRYTSESGVRGLKRCLELISRKTALYLDEGKDKVSINVKNLSDFFDERPLHHDVALKEAQPGIVTGLAWTAAGGEILYIETLFTKGSGKLIITGQLGDVMKESAEIALSLVKSLYPDKAEFFSENDLHIHVPEGAVPKDGPSAGITLTTAIASLVTKKAIDPKVGMTGEISLRGAITAIGGLPEKLMAAQRAGLKKILIPAENEKDLKDIAKEVLDELEITPVKNIQEALHILNIPSEHSLLVANNSKTSEHAKA